MKANITKIADFMDRHYLESVYKVSASFRMFEFEACKVFKTKEFTFVNDCFKDEHNPEVSGDIMDKHYLAAINSSTFLTRQLDYIIK